VLDVLPLVRHTAEHLGVRLDYLPPPLAVVVEADAGALQQVIVNLLLNAIEAASAGQAAHGAGEDASQCRVSLTLTHTDARRARIRVADSGPGPRDDVAPRMFEPLVSDKADGAGLGLAVAREIVEQHGGTVAWRREAGETVFQIELPSAVEAVHGTTADR
jgi:signal transduction histidine kinase